MKVDSAFSWRFAWHRAAYEIQKHLDSITAGHLVFPNQRMNLFLKAVIAIAALVVLISAVAAQSIRISGTVRDTTASVVTGAAVHIRAGEYSATTKTDSNGEFTFAQVPNGPGLLEVIATGFAETSISWVSSPGSATNIVLKPANVNEEVVVSAARSELKLSETPGSMVRLSGADVAASPSLTVDDMLRQVPGFSLFRRSSSRTANPTSQGVSLRGLGASGPSRALVLEDGIPLMDPFGGWVYWNRIPPIEVSSVEVFRGGASNLYGSDAMGGVVQFISREAERPAFSLETFYGNEKTPNVSLWAGDTIGKWNFEAATDLFRSDGYVLVPSSQRGSIDTPANSEHATLDLGIGYRLGSSGKIFAKGNFYDEFRNNGTPVQTNDTQIGEGAVGLDQQFGGSNSLSLRIFGDAQGYNQRFSSIASDRSSESLTDIQHVPAQQLGGTAQWTHVLGKTQTLIIGSDIQEVIGSTNEQLFSSGRHTANNMAGGRQRTFGIFGDDIFRFRQRWTVILGARFDDWWNLDASTVRIPISPPGITTGTAFPDRSDIAFNPRLSVLRSLNSNVSVTASAYRSLRAPTLNELYRSFRLGSVITNSNASLRAERLTGAEAGMNVTALNQKLELRGTFFWSDIVDPVANVTLSTTPSLITRQRQNLGRTRSRGVEFDSVVHVNKSIQISAGYDYTDATVVSFPAGANLQGLDIPEVPRHTFTWEGRYWNPKILLLSVQGRFVGKQFDDDQNLFPLDSFYTMDFLAGRPVTKNLEIFAAAENMLNQQYMVARTPITNLGPPILFRVGLRLNFPATR
jgi:outer membrane receptor protein involved in Fe transport